MKRNFGKNRRASTIIRDNKVHAAYKELQKEIGNYFHCLPRSLIYTKIQERTGLCTKTIGYILNHTEKCDVE